MKAKKRSDASARKRRRSQPKRLLFVQMARKEQEVGPRGHGCLHWTERGLVISRACPGKACRDYDGR